MTIFGIVEFVNGVLLLVLSVLLWRRQKEQKTAKDISYMLLCVSLWSFGYFLWQGSESEIVADFWVRVMMIPVMFVPLFYSKFIIQLLDKLKVNKIGLYLSYVFAVVFSVGTALGYLNDGVEHKVEAIKFSPNAGVLFTPFIIFFFVSLFYYVFLMAYHYRKVSPVLKVQIRYNIFGIVFAYMGTVSNYFLWYDIRILPVGNIFLPIFLFIIVYAFLSRHVPDPRLILRKSLVNLLSLSILIAIVLALKVVAIREIPRYAFVLDLFILMHAVFVYPRIKKLFYGISNRYFFTSLYDPAEVITKLTDKLNSTLEIDAIMDHIYTTFSSTFHMESLAVLSYEKPKRRYLLEYKFGFLSVRKKIFPVIRYLHDKYIQRNHPIVMEEIKSHVVLSGNQDFANLMSYGVDVIMPLNVGKKTFGIIVLGPKMTKEIYNADDLKILKTMSEQIALAIGNALQYQQLKDFNKNLEEEVARQTKKLREANEELKKLDRAKSEFITLASHQLRTPLTAIRGFLNLLFEGMYGKYDPVIGDVLKKVYAASNRLGKLIEDLLVLSKIEAGTFEISFEKVKPIQFLTSIVEPFKTVARENNVALVLQIPKAMPALMIDKKRMQDVITNLIDNAFKYTKIGTVTIVLSRKGNSLQLMVEDTGNGITEKEMQHLFEKFARGTKQRRMYVDGVGIGLYISKEIIEAHGGKIWAQSEGEGKGSQFFVEIPFESKIKSKEISQS